MKAKSYKIALIGAGNVATQLGFAFIKAGHTIEQVFSKHRASALALSIKLDTSFTTITKSITPKADIYIIAVNDDAIETVIKQLKIKDKIIVHTSGSVDMTVLKAASKNFGVFYPLQTLSKTKKVNFKNVPICIEASNESTFYTISSLASSISNNQQKIDSEQRRTIHLAAVFACNFSNHLYLIAAAILAEKKLSFQLLRPLIKETAKKIKYNSPAEVQTGPAIRGDKKTMDTHLKMLSSNKEYAALYNLLSKSIIESGKKKK